MRKIARKLYHRIPLKQPAFELLRRVVRMPESVYRHLHFEGVIDVPVAGRSFRMRHHGTQIESEVFWSGLFGRWEGASLRAWVAAAAGAANTGEAHELSATPDPTGELLAGKQAHTVSVPTVSIDTLVASGVLAALRRVP